MCPITSGLATTGKLPRLAVSSDTLTGGVEALVGREWIVTNGLGGYAAGTIAGTATRRYHGLLVAAHPPPVARWVLVAGADLSMLVDDREVPLSAQEYPDGLFAPAGLCPPMSFELVGQRPVWRWHADGNDVEQTVWMPYGENRTCVRLHNRGARSVRLRWRPFAPMRWFHELTRGASAAVEVSCEAGDRVRISAPSSPLDGLIAGSGWSFRPAAHWYWNFVRRVERARGFDAEEDAFSPGVFEAVLEPDQAATLQLSTGDAPPLDDPDASLRDFDGRGTRLIDGAAGELERRLRIAADQFLVHRGPRIRGRTPLPNTVIAGYPWFGDWGRDTMIGLPGLCLATGRPDVARSLLLSYARFVDRGMVPNRWPDAGEEPEYIAADAALWFLYALEAYVKATDDVEILEGLSTAIVDIVDWYRRGTRHGIRVDPADGLVTAGADGLQLTWMDAKFGDWVVTPRRGKPVEINALWCAALQFALDALDRIGWNGVIDRELAATARSSFAARFWNPRTECLFDVVDGPDGDDPSIRPNQVVAVALDIGLLDPDRAASVVGVVERELLTPFGLRSLAPGHADYRRHYGGGPAERDGAYHQGVAWSWLLGMFVHAKLAVGASPVELRPLIDATQDHLQAGAVGTVSELFQPEPPHAPDGAFAQAWGVAEWLRAARALGGIDP